MRIVQVAAAVVSISAIAAAQPSPEEIRTIAERGYIFAYPIVLMEYTRRAAMERGTLGAPGGPNQFTHAQQFPDDRFHQVIRPNADTLYSSSWIDLSKEPVLLHVPDTHDRYYLMQFMDAWTETFSVPGKRSTGTGEGWFAIVGPNWKGTLPERAQRIDAPTNMVWLIGRTQTNGASDYENVHAIQRGYQLMTVEPVSGRSAQAARHETRTQTSAAAGTPPMLVQKLTPEEFFRTFAELLAANPPHPDDAPMMRELAKIGIEPGKPFRAEALKPQGMKALDMGAMLAAERLASLDGRNGKAGRPVDGRRGKSRALRHRLRGEGVCGAHRFGRESAGRRGLHALS